MQGDFSRFTHKPRKRYTGVLRQQGRVDLDADWNEQIAIQEYLARSAAEDVIGRTGVPKERGGFQISGSTPDFMISPGRIYVDGILCELETRSPGERITYTNQPDHPNPPRIEPSNGRTDLVYLDVWKRHITAIEDPDIREVALGGPDTTTRLQTVAQVKVLMNVGNVQCDDSFDLWDKLTKRQAGGLTAEEAVASDVSDLCIVRPGAGYRGLENRLYRVEIHKPGRRGQATFKWSRDNGSVTFAVAEAAGARDLKLSRLGRDRILSVGPGDWIEILDDEKELRGEPGPLLQVESVDEAQRIISLEGEVPELGSHAKVRRWDVEDGEIATAAGPIVLEDGVQVRFSDGDFRTGDYWTFAARVETGKVERLDDAPPQGVAHHYCRLALVTWTSSDPSIRDCRPEFPSLTELIGLAKEPGIVVNSVRKHSTGETLGNESTIAPNDLLAGLDVACSEEVDDDFIRHFSCFLTLETPEIVTKSTQVTAPTGEKPTGAPATGLISAAHLPQHAQTESAQQQETEPSKSPKEAGSTQSTGIMGVLAGAAQTGLGGGAGAQSPTSSQQSQQAPATVPSATPSAAQGQPVFQIARNVVQQAQTAEHTPATGAILTIPQTRLAQLAPREDKVIIGYRPLVLDADREVDGTTVRWKLKSKDQVQWITERLSELPGSRPRRLLARLTLSGNFIRSEDRYLDGDTFGGAPFPSGDGRRGGDFVMWFWVVPFILMARPIPPPPPEEEFDTADTATVKAGNVWRLTVGLNRPAPLSGAVVSLTSSNPTVAAVPPSIVVPPGSTSATVDVSTTAVPSLTTVFVNASRGAVTKTTTLRVDPTLGPLLKVNGVRFVRTGASTATTKPVVVKKVENPSEPVKIKSSAGADAIDVDFINGPPGIETVRAQETFEVISVKPPGHLKGSIVSLAPMGVRFTVRPHLQTLPKGTYDVVLKGGIKSVEGRPLDGEPGTKFPSGNNVEGGNFFFHLVVE